jgi:hypothetical protein
VLPDGSSFFADIDIPVPLGSVVELLVVDGKAKILYESLSTWKDACTTFFKYCILHLMSLETLAWWANSKFGSLIFIEQVLWSQEFP